MATDCVPLGSTDFQANDVFEDDQFVSFLKALAAEDESAPIQESPTALDCVSPPCSENIRPAAGSSDRELSTAGVSSQFPSRAHNAAGTKRAREREKNRRNAAAYRERCRVCL